MVVLTFISLSIHKLCSSIKSANQYEISICAFHQPSSEFDVLQPNFVLLFR